MLSSCNPLNSGLHFFHTTVGGESTNPPQSIYTRNEILLYIPPVVLSTIASTYHRNGNYSESGTNPIPV
jgi:hypothetical protein